MLKTNFVSFFSVYSEHSKITRLFCTPFRWRPGHLPYLPTLGTPLCKQQFTTVLKLIWHNIIWNIYPKNHLTMVWTPIKQDFHIFVIARWNTNPSVSTAPKQIESRPTKQNDFADETTANKADFTASDKLKSKWTSVSEKRLIHLRLIRAQAVHHTRGVMLKIFGNTRRHNPNDEIQWGRAISCRPQSSPAVVCVRGLQVLRASLNLI